MTPEGAAMGLSTWALHDLAEPPPCIRYRRRVNQSASAREAHRAFDHALFLLFESEKRAPFVGAFLPHGGWAPYRKAASYSGALGATEGAYGRDPGNWVHAVVFRFVLLAGPPLPAYQVDMANEMGDEKLADVLEAVLSLGRPESAWRAQALPHVDAITKAVEALEEICAWAWSSGALGAISGIWPSSREMARTLL